MDGNGSLSFDEFMTLPELQQNPLVARVIDLFDTDHDGEVDFKGTVQWPCCIAHYHGRNPMPGGLPASQYYS